MAGSIDLAYDSVEAMLDAVTNYSAAEKAALYEAALITAARGDDIFAFKAYCLYVHGWELEPHHIEWASYLIAGEPVCIIAPPETGKSRLIRAWCEWSIGRRRDRAIMTVQNTGAQAKKNVWAVGQVIQASVRYRKVFPECKPTENWAKDAIYVTRSGLEMEFRIEPTMAGFGIDGAYQGVHIDDLIIDDPTDQKDVNSEPTMLMQREQITGVLYDRLKEGGNLFVILTRWGDNDLVSVFEQLGVKILVYPAWKDKHDPYPWDAENFTDGEDSEHPVSLLCENWANYQRLRKLQAAKDTESVGLFKLTYLCQTEGAVRGERIFPMLEKSKHYKPGRAYLPLDTKWAKHTIGVDWGTTVQHQSTQVIVGKTKRGQVVVRASWMSPKGDSAELGAKTNEWKTKYKCYNVWYDRSQGSLKAMFNAMNMGAFKGESSVDLRIGALRTLLENNMFFIDNEGELASTLWSQLTNYRRDENGRVIEVSDDLVDALLYAICAIIDPVTIGLGKNVEIAPRQDVKHIDPEHDDFDPTKETVSIFPTRSMKNWGV